jgi:hypothetical protein
VNVKDVVLSEDFAILALSGFLIAALVWIALDAIGVF